MDPLPDIVTMGSMGGAVFAEGKVKAASIEAVVTRCGCGDPLRIHPGRPCPRPLKVENRGVVAYYHRNFLRRWWGNSFTKELWEAFRAPQRENFVRGLFVAHRSGR